MKIVLAPLTVFIYVLYGYQPTMPLLVIRSPSFKEAGFVVHLSHKLAVQPLRTYQVRNPFDCAFKCLGHDQCLSFNMAVSSTGEFRLCYLLTSDMNNNLPYFRPSEEFDFYGIVESMPVHQNPCKNGGSWEAAQNRCVCPVNNKGDHCEWIKLNTNPVHLEANNDKFGPFNSIQSGQILKFKLVYISGGMTCWLGHHEFTKFGCGPKLAVLITNTSNQIISPNPSYLSVSLKYRLPGVASNDTEIILPEIHPPLHVKAAQEFRLWYGEDLINRTEGDNVGTLDLDVYAFYA